ncbi:branched-chain amino acid ABC transporter permease [Nitratireductor sp. XY-223]|uniref:branched-chain amino acid ABC transporter permease n=1 Tax=Nitratireductor sp. XY-223 TaxID=2561926 RepID=UPI0010AA2D58|nr:branched-chain amino acid ABC transporter permease [Nitratireductor sp. XY-223]
MKIYGLFLISGLAVGSLYALGGIGLVVLRRATGVLNFAYGAIAAAAAMVCWQFGQWDFPGPAAWLSALVTGTALSLLYGMVVAPGLAWREPAVKAVATLGFALIILGVVSFLWDDAARKLVLPTDKMGVRLLGMKITVTRMIAFFGSIAILIGAVLYLDKTRTGLHMRALADNRDHSALIGIPVFRVETAAWALSGALAGFTGLMFGDLVRLDPTVITFTVIPAIAAAVCGRLNSLPLTFAGGLAIGVCEAMLTLVKPLAPLRSMTPFLLAALVILWMQRKETLTFAREG